MLTRLEVKGFKNLVDFAVAFGPFTCIGGENGVGKSNVFDAIEFLSLLASETFTEAAQRVRSASGFRGGDPRELFWDGYSGTEHTMSLAAEMLVPATVEDDLGAEARASTTFLRYELQLGYETPVGAAHTGRLNLLHEALTHITRGLPGDRPGGGSPSRTRQGFAALSCRASVEVAPFCRPGTTTRAHS